MPQRDANEIKEKILRIISEKGPSLPVQISGGIGMNMLFTSAFLSELLAERKLKMTHMRVGSSPVYFIEGQEKGLEKYASYLKSKEKEAYELLRQSNFLVDSEQLPAIRVALRAIKDFAIPSQNQEVWRYFLVTEEYSKSPEKIIESEVSNLEKTSEKAMETSREIQVVESVEESSEQFVEDKNEIVQEVSSNLEKDSSEEIDFCERVRKKLLKLNVKLLEETEAKKKEFSGIGRIETYLGEIELLIIGKDKKSITDKDLEKLFVEATEQKKLILFLSTGEIAKKTKEVYRNYKNLIIFEKI